MTLEEASGSWLLLARGGGPTADKPTVTFTPPADADQVSHAMTLRVADCRAANEVPLSPGAAFLTAPRDRGGETTVLPARSRRPFGGNQPVHSQLIAA